MLDKHGKYAYHARMNSKFTRDQVVEKLGGIKQACEFFKCQPQAIYQWPKNEPIPRQRQLELLLYRPELFKEQAA